MGLGWVGFSRYHLERLAGLGPRVAGSYENEVRAVDLLVREVALIRHMARSDVHVIETDVQRPSGVLLPDAGDGVNTVYDRLTNVVVRIGPAGDRADTGRALLVNAHFDSVAGSPGNTSFYFWGTLSCLLVLDILTHLLTLTLTFLHILS